MIGSAHIIRGNALDLPLADNSVDLVVTSPPYFALRSYQDGGEHYTGQIGSEAAPAEFVDALIAATAEMVRVVKPCGSIWVNLGDKYASSTTPGPQSERSKLEGGRHKGVDDVLPRRIAPGAPTKSLIGIPWRYAIRCIDELGLILRAEVIWSKPNGLPESVTDRVRRSHEQWFHFTLEPRYFSAVDEIREEHSANSHARRSDGAPTPKQSSGLDLDVRRGYMAETYTNPLGKLPGSVWTVATEPLRVPDHLGIDHFAAFPTEWPRRIIQGWTSPVGNCTVCGEGRRPVTQARFTEQDRLPDNRSVGTGEWLMETRRFGRATREPTITGYACACTPTRTEIVPAADTPDDYDNPDDWQPYDEITVYDWQSWTPAPTTPAVVADVFGGTGTTALVAKALGRTGITVDYSGDYCRLAQWRTNDPDQLAKASRVDKPPKQIDGQIGFNFEDIA